MFLREYYSGHSIARNTVRLIGGPLVAGTGVYFYQKPDKWAVAYGGFCFLYGLYFTFKPFLIIALRPAAFQAKTFEIVVKREEDNKKEEQPERVIVLHSLITLTNP